MIIRKSLAVTTAALALGSGIAVAAPAAQAEQSSHATTVSKAATAKDDASLQARHWRRIWGPQSHTPTKYWATPDFVPRSNQLGAQARCWGGDDGTRIKVDIVRTRDKKVIKHGVWKSCDGRFKATDTNGARGGTSYYMRVYLKGHKHTIEAQAFHKV
ncbi:MULTISPECIES: hypothetical protein [unclassified Streptomyces]|uniref:hypothetical protein n=1 Tax=unclassified Streptomyces TaxID=2593676 RepID=UPI00336AC1F2